MRHKWFLQSVVQPPSCGSGFISVFYSQIGHTHFQYRILLLRCGFGLGVSNIPMQYQRCHSFIPSFIHSLRTVSQRSPCQSQVSKWNNHNIIIMYYVRLWIFIIYLLGMLPGASLECLQIDAWTSPIVPELMFMAGMTLIRRKAATDREKRRRPKWRVCFELCSQAPVITIV